LNKSVLVFGFGLSLLTACPLVELEVAAPEVCLRYPDVHVDGFDGATGVTTIHQSFVVDDLSAIHDITDGDADVTFVRGELLALAGVDGFAHVDAARITISGGDGASSLPPLTLYQCAGDCVPEDGTLDMTPEVEQDALAYLRLDAITVDLEVTGELPRDPWAMDVAVCFATSARVQP
jgi:hypothetical protein